MDGIREQIRSGHDGVFVPGKFRNRMRVPSLE